MSKSYTKLTVLFFRGRHTNYAHSMHFITTYFYIFLLLFFERIIRNNIYIYIRSEIQDP